MSLQAPPDELLQRYPWAYRELATRVLWAVQVAPGTRVTSWYRSLEENRRVGGAEYSQHRLGLAFDLVVPLQQEADVVRRLRQAGVVPVQESTHVHVQAYPAGTLPHSLFA